MKIRLLIFSILISSSIYADVYVEPDTSCCTRQVHSIKQVSSAINNQTTVIHDVSKEIKDLNKTIKSKQLKCPEVKQNDDCSLWGSIFGALISGIIAILIFVLGYFIDKKREKERKAERLNEIRIHLFNLLGQILDSIGIQIDIIHSYTSNIKGNPYDIFPIAKFNHSDLDRLLLLDTNDVRQIFVNDKNLGLDSYIRLYRNVDHVKGTLGEIFVNLKSYTNSEIRDLIKKIVEERNRLLEIVYETSTRTMFIKPIEDILNSYNTQKDIGVNVQMDFNVLINPLHQLFKANPELIEEYTEMFNQNRKIGNLVMTLIQMNTEQMEHMNAESGELKKSLNGLKEVYSKNAPQQ